MLAVFPLTMVRDRRWWSHCPSMGSPEMSTSFFARQLKKGAVDLPYTSTRVKLADSPFSRQFKKSPKEQKLAKQEPDKITSRRQNQVTK